MKVNILEEKKTKLVFTLEDEGNTICAALENELWTDKKVKLAGYYIDHPLIGIPRFIVETNGEDPKKAISSAIKRLKKQSNEINKAASKQLK